MGQVRKKRREIGAVKQTIRVIFLFLAAVLLLLPSPVIPADEAALAMRLQNCIRALSRIMSSPQSSIPQALLQRATAVVIVPDLLKASFFFGGRYGKGVLMPRTGDGRWGNPVMVTLGGGSFGIQAGIQSTDLVLVLRQGKKTADVPKGGIILGADATIIAGVGVIQMDENVSSDATLEVYSFSRSRGLSAGFSLQGMQLRLDDEETGNLYGKSGIRAADVLSKSVPVTQTVQVAKFKDSFLKVTGLTP